MPQNTVISNALSSAKTTLAHSNAAFPSSKPAPVKVSPSAPKSTPTIGDELKAKQANVNQYLSAPKMHNGGPVKKDGTYQLQKGEHVLAAHEVAKVHKHALMAAGLSSMAKGYKAGDSQKAAGAKPVVKTASGKGTPVKIDAAHKKPEKKETKDIKLRPETNQGAQVKQQMER